MTDEELIARLRKFGQLWPDDAVAADRIEALVKELSTSNEVGRAFEEDAGQQRARAEAAEARIATLTAQNGALRAERDETYAYAKHLAETIFANGKFDAPQWKPLEDTLGVLTQIDNMVAGIRARAALTTEADNG